MPKHMAVWPDQQKAHVFQIHASTVVVTYANAYFERLKRSRLTVT